MWAGEGRRKLAGQFSQGFPRMQGCSGEWQLRGGGEGAPFLSRTTRPLHLSPEAGP